ncbi:kin of IRRE-like protein 1 [Saccoglossus kowalevskii]|uniref:Kin of IRRE-like protein 1-like n=1 Tax=Saccoglossus kowalevskii TaxID=10224 RepID=A0ABM0M652_SACKO|nr:PREDICTED: kin of IRRE-like protein 1-like [Saccoglossus kowalevskii]
MVLKVLSLTVLLISSRLCAGAYPFMVTPKPTTVLAGKTAIIECTVAISGNESPSFSVFWQIFPGGEQITLATNRNTTDKYSILGGAAGGQYDLKVENTDASDDKSYQCAVYDMGTTTRSDPVRLEVVRPEETTFPQCFLSPRNSIDEGKTETAYCVSGNPNNTLSWNYRGRPVIGTLYRTEEYSSVEYDIHAKYEDHGVEYICYASVNNESCSIVLDVRYAPRVTIDPVEPQYPQQDTARFTCIADGNPTMFAYRWLFGATEIDQTYSHHRFNHFAFEDKGRVLVIPSVVMEDSRVRITCEVTNELGTQSAYTLMYVRGTTLTMETLGPIIVGCICGALVIILLIWTVWYCLCDCRRDHDHRRRPPPGNATNLPNLRSTGYGPESSDYLRHGRSNATFDNSTEVDSNTTLEMNERRPNSLPNNNAYSTPPGNRRLDTEIRKTYKNLDIGDDDVGLHSGSYDVNPDPEPNGTPKEID